MLKSYLEGRLSKLVAQRLDMDDDEAWRFAVACGGAMAAMAGHEPFDRHLRDVIERYGLTMLFREAGLGRYHQAIRPTGYDHDAVAVLRDAGALADWGLLVALYPGW